MTPPAPLQLPTADEALAWVRDRTATGLARPASWSTGCASDAAGRAGGRAAAVGRGHAGARATSAALAVAARQRAPRRARCARPARRAEVEVDKLVTELRQDRALYEVFAALDPAGLDPTAARLLEKTLEDFRRAGVDHDDATRAPAGRDQRAAHRDRPGVQPQHPRRRPHRPGDARAARRAAGGLARRAPGRRRRAGHRHDRLPGRGAGADVRPRPPRSVTRSPSPSSSAAGRSNEPLLEELFALRHEYANLVGYADWASYDADVKMIEKGPAIPEFIDRIAAGRAGADGARPRGPARALPPGRARRRLRSTSPTRSTTRSWCARSSTTSTPSGCAPTSTSTRCSRGCST